MNAPIGPGPIDGSAQNDGSSSIDGKDAAAFRTIGEVANALGIRQHVLRYWEEHFPTLRPLTRAGGRRYYRPEDVALVMEIDRLLNREGYTIKGAKQALRGAKVALKQPVVSETTVANDGAGENNSDYTGLATALRGLRNRLAAALAD